MALKEPNCAIRRGPVHSRADETAYYLNGRLPRLILIARGVRFPAGTWIRVADGQLAPWEVESVVMDLFAGLKHRPLPFTVLLTDFDVDEFTTG